MRYRLFSLITLVVFSATLSAAETDGPVFEYRGKTYSGDQLPSAVLQPLQKLRQEYDQQRRNIFDQYVLNRYLQEEAERTGRDPGALQQEWLAVDNPSDAELRAFYDANQARIQGSFEQVKSNLAQYLTNQRRAQKQQELLERIREETGYQLELPAIKPLRFDVSTRGYPSEGPADAPVTLVEFFDYQCPHCKKARPVIRKLLEEYEGDLRVVYRDFPINPSGVSRKVAVAAVCSQRQDSYKAFHDLAFDRQRFLKSLAMTDLAEEAGLEMAAFEACLASDEARERVAASEAEARALGLNSTPSFFVNGLPLADSHGDLAAALGDLIEAELQSADQGADQSS